MAEQASAPQIVVRAVASAEDFQAILAIRRQVFVVEQGVINAVTNDPQDRYSHHVVGLVDGRIVGAGRVHITGQEAQIAWVAVLAEHRRQGVGRAIMLRLVETADQAGVQLLLLNAQTHARRFYERLGFEAVGSVFTMGGIEHQLMTRYALLP